MRIGNYRFRKMYERNGYDYICRLDTAIDWDEVVEKQLDPDKIVPFKDFPFKVLEDTNMKMLIASIRMMGILEPVMVRKKDDDLYEMISGHRRLYAAKKLHLSSIPAVIVELDDDLAAILAVDTNIQRGKHLPSETAHAQYMRRDGVKKLHKKASANREEGTGKPGRKSNGLSSRQIQRYTRLSYLNSGLLDMVDRKQLSIQKAVELSYLPEDVQYLVYILLCEYGWFELENIKRLRKYLQFFKLDEEDILSVLFGGKDKYGLIQE